MPDTLRKDLTDLIRGIVADWFEADPALLKRLKVANRYNETEQGWLRKFIAKAPADFGNMKCVVEKLKHSGWTRAPALAAEAQAFRASTCGFPVIRTASVVVTLRYRLPVAEEQDQNLGDEIVNALFDAGPLLGDNGYVAGLGETTVEERDTRAGEAGHPGKVATIKFDVQCQQQGRDLLDND